MDIDDIEDFIRIDKHIDDSEERATDAVRESLQNRWEFGRLMLAKRKGKKLPDGYLDALAAQIGKSRSELQYRMQFAEQYSTEDELSNAVGQFTSWRQVITSLPKPRTGQSKSKPTSAPTPNARREELVNLNQQQGKTIPEIVAETGVPKGTVRKELERNAIAEAAEAAAAPIAWDTIPGNQRDKLERAKASIRKEVERESRTRLLAELDQYRAKLDEDFAAHKAAYDAQNARINELRDEERRRYKEGIEVYRAKGLITPDEYNTIRSCLHPDSRRSVTDEKLAAAFRLFNDSRIKTLLVKEK